MSEPQAEAVIDLDAYRANLEALAACAPGSALMAVVKANAYGHGMEQCARAAREAGADWLGVATPAEALTLRSLGDTGPVLCWLAAPGADYASVIEADVEVTASSVRAAGGDPRRGAESTQGPAQGRHRAVAQRCVRRGVDSAGRGHRQGPVGWAARAHRHLVALRLRRRTRSSRQRHAGAGVHPGSRGARGRRAGTGTAPPLELRRHARAPERAPRSGAGGHLVVRARPRPPHDVRHPAAPRDDAARTSGEREARAGGHERLLRPSLHDGPRDHAGPRPARLRRGSAAQRVEPGRGGLRRAARPAGRHHLHGPGRRRPRRPSGRSAATSSRLFGPGDDGEPTAQEWADAADTITYEVVTRIGGRTARTYRGAR